MKTVFFAFVSFLSFPLFAQEVNPPPQYCFKVITMPSLVFHFHSPRKDCKYGFGFCMEINPGEYGLVPCNKVSDRKDEVSLEKDIVRYAIYVNEKEAMIYLPAELRQAKGFEKEDMSIFHIDSDNLVFRDSETGVSIRLRAGSYPVTEREGRLVAAVDTELADSIQAR